MNRPTVAAIVLTYNGWDRVKKCLATVLAQDWPDLKILVVDNGSADKTPEKIRATYPGVEVLSLPENLGFAGANNAGVSHTRSDYVALISDDVFLPGNFISSLVAALEADPRAALAGPGVFNLQLNMAHYPYNGSMSLTGTVIQNVFRDTTLTFGAAGCSLIYKRDLLGLPFDEDYGFFHEEIYLAWRARLKGFTVLRLPNVVVKHIGGATVGKLDDENRYYLERNRLLNYLTLFSGRTRRRAWPLWCLARLGERAGDWRQGRSQKPLRRARRWIRAHKTLVRAKRQTLQSERKVPDQEIIRWMTCRVTNQQGLAGRWLNRLALWWCWLAGLKTWEFQEQSRP